MINNSEYHFGVVPQVEIPRSKFLMHQNIRTTFNAGLLIPFAVDSEVMPGDTYKVSGTFVIRQSTPIYPTMDNSFADIFVVRVPHRLVWTHFKQFMGENDTGNWTQQTDYEVPKISLNNGINGMVEKGDTLNYMGVPLTNNLAYGSGKEIKISALPMRAYQLTWNEWFRDENVCPPYYIVKDDTETTIYRTSTSNVWGKYYVSTAIDPKPAPVFKYKDYFNACLPDTQKGSAVTLPIGDRAPIMTLETTYDVKDMKGLTWGNTSSGNTTALTNDMNLVVHSNSHASYPNQTVVEGTAEGTASVPLVPNNLYADLSNAIAATINAQRMAFATQRILEQGARTGTRYCEIIRGFFGVKTADSRLQRPEILCAKRIPITMTQVAQTSSTDTTSPQGNVAAYSLTVDSNHLCTFSNTEHCTILYLICVRQEHSYDSGLQRQWTKFKKLDWYWPQLAFLGEQPIYNREIYLAGYDQTGNTTDNQVFGYNERWAELRYKPNMNTGAFSTRYNNNLGAWHYGDSYNSLPVLSFDWRKETKEFIDRTLAVTSQVEDQYIMDCRLEFEATRPIPMFSIPGLLDHF